MIWYFTNASADGLWETLGNWNDAIDGSGNTISEVPWTTATTAGDDLVYATGIDDTVSVNSEIGFGFTITGTCSLLVTNVSGTIDGGTYADLFTNSTGSITGGIFNGDVINNAIIDGGNFTGSVTNNGNIYSGTFTGSVDNGSTIQGGNFTGTFLNGGDIYAGTFTGSVDNYGYINGGIFTGSVDNGNTINIGQYITKGTIKQTDLHGVISNVKGQNNPNPYPSLFITLEVSDILGSGLL